MDQSELASSDWFFYWDSIELKRNVDADVLSMLVQPKHALFYNRGYGCGVPAREQQPNTALLLITARYDVVIGFASRNARVTDGRYGPDRRAFTSQAQIDITQVGSKYQLSVSYLRPGDRSYGQASIPWGTT
jgi:hypothetical protein